VKHLSRRLFLAGLAYACPTCTWGWPQSDTSEAIDNVPNTSTNDLKQQLLGCQIARGDTSKALSRRLTRSAAGDLSSALDLIQQYEVPTLKAFLGVEPDVAIYLDDSPNALALRPSNEASHEGLILLGKNLIIRLIELRGQSSLIGVLAHEAAHLLQFQSDPQLPAGKVAEIHADYLAGWYLATKIRNGSRGINLSDFELAVEQLGDTDFGAPDHHGTPRERYEAAFAGAHSSRSAMTPTIQSAYVAGLEYAKATAEQSR
jgi:hypothetical protein